MKFLENLVSSAKAETVVIFAIFVRAHPKGPSVFS